MLLEADQLSFRFDLLSLFGSHIKIGSVKANNGALTIRYDRRGKPNYEILKPADPKDAAAESSGLGISLQEALLSDIELIYADDQLEQTVRLEVDDARFSGEFSARNFSLNSQAAMLASFIEVGGRRYASGAHLGYDATLQVDMDKGIYQFDKMGLSVNDNLFHVNGVLTSGSNHTDFDLKISSEDSKLGAVIDLLPESFQEYLGDFESRGEFNFEATIDGRLSSKENPAIRVNFGLEDGRITSPRLTDDFKDVSFTAIFSNGEGRDNLSAVFQIPRLKGYFNRELVEAQFEMKNMDDPVIDLLLDGALPLASIYGLFNNPAISDGRGELEIRNFHLQGRYKDMINTQSIDRVKAEGQLTFDDASLTINKETLVFDRGQVTLEGNLLNILGVKLEGAGTELTFNGSANNLLPVLLADSINSQDAQLDFKATLEAEQLDLDRLMIIGDIPVEQNSVDSLVFDSLQVAQTQKREHITNFLKGTFDANIKSFNFREIQADNFKGNLVFDRNLMNIKGSAMAMEGSIDLEGEVKFEDKPSLRAKLTGRGIDMHELFRQSENFGQTVLEAQHLSGNLDANVIIQGYWSENGNFDMDKLKAYAVLGITDGELKDFSLLESFSAYVKIQDLKHIKFVNLENWLEVSGKKVIIPAMFVQSNALNMQVSGEHTFENLIDYNIKINAGQVLFNRFKKFNPNLEPQKAQRNGWFNMYFNIQGPLETYEVTSSKRDVKNQFTKTESIKRRIQRNLLEAFGSITVLKKQIDMRDEGEAAPKDDTEYIDGF